MKYIIVEKGTSIFGTGDTIYGYVTTETKALFLCTSFNNNPHYNSEYYFEKIDETTPGYNLLEPCLDYIVEEIEKENKIKTAIGNVLKQMCSDEDLPSDYYQVIIDRIYNTEAIIENCKRNNKPADEHTIVLALLDSIYYSEENRCNKDR